MSNIRFKPKAAIPALAFALIKAAVLFLAAGTVHWWQGWASTASDIVFGLLAAVLLYEDDPQLLQERKTAAKKAKPWDKKIVPLVILVLPLTLLIVAGLDQRWHWAEPMPAEASVLGLLGMAVSNGIFIWAHRSNKFFSSFARIQTDRGHQVVSTGPYRFVRHPGYLGLIIGCVAWPVVLGSWLALGVGCVMVALNLVRTGLEDRMLKEDLEGYGEYAERVRYRLVWGVW